MPSSTYDFDVAVLGGGPAGASAAITLAQQGLKAVILERDRFPRFHIGESLLASVNESLASLGLLEDVRRQGFQKKYGASFQNAAGTIARYADFSSSDEVPTPQTFQVPRERFDEILLDGARRAGVDVREEHRAVDVTTTGGADGGAEISFVAPPGEGRLRARAVIDATGRAGVLQRKLGLRIDEPGLANIAIYAHYRGVPPLEGRREGDIRIVARLDMGWFWLIPISPELMSVGVVLPRAEFEALCARVEARNDHEALLRAAIADTPSVAALLADAERVWPVRVEKDYSYAVKAYAGERWLLAGDAGSFLDPVFSTGVSVALDSGREAALALAEALRRGDLSARAFAAFDALQRRRYAAFRRFVLAFYTRPFRDLFFQSSPWPSMFAALVTLLAGRWRPGPRYRLLIAIFFLLVRVQRYVPLAKPLDRPLEPAL